MLARYLSTLPAGFAMTLGLLWGMQYLIQNGETVITNDGPGLPTFLTSTKIDTPVKTIKPRPVRPPEPMRAPPLVPPSEPTTPVIGIGIPAAMPVQPGPLFRQRVQTGTGNSLLNIVDVRPEYPIAASRRGIEGYVVVAFDVTEAGTVDNVVVVESSHRVFERAAINAAYRSRYRSPIVDGTPQPSRGVQKLYRFEMEND